MKYFSINLTFAIIVALLGVATGNFAALKRESYLINKDNTAFENYDPRGVKHFIQKAAPETSSKKSYENGSRIKRDLSWTDILFGRFGRTQSPVNAKTTSKERTQAMIGEDGVSQEPVGMSSHNTANEQNVTSIDQSTPPNGNKYTATQSYEMTTAKSKKYETTNSEKKVFSITPLPDKSRNTKRTTPSPPQYDKQREITQSEKNVKDNLFKEFIQQENRAPWMLNQDERYLTFKKKTHVTVKDPNPSVTNENSTVSGLAHKLANVGFTNSTKAPERQVDSDMSSQASLASSTRRRPHRIRHQRKRNKKLRRIKPMREKVKAKTTDQTKAVVANFSQPNDNNNESYYNVEEVIEIKKTIARGNQKIQEEEKGNIEDINNSEDDHDKDEEELGDKLVPATEEIGSLEMPSVEPPCPTCGKNNMPEEEIIELRKAMVEDLLMRKLRIDPQELAMAERSEHSGLEKEMPKLPRYVLDQTYSDNSVDEDDEFYARDKEIIIPGTDMGRDCISMETTGCYTFNIGNKIKYDIASAELWLYKMRDRHDISGQTFVVYELDRDLSDGQLQRRNLVVRKDTFTKEDWISVNVTWPLTRWVDKRLDQQMLAIRCKTCSTRNHRALFGTKHGYKPLLIVKYADRHVRKKRDEDESCDPRSTCCKRNLVVDLHSVTLHKILRPQNLSVGYCFGSCEDVDQFTYNHTTIKQRYRWTLPSNSNMRTKLTPCCAPLVLKSAMVLMGGDEDIEAKILPNILVESCGCL